MNIAFEITSEGILNVLSGHHLVRAADESAILSGAHSVQLFEEAQTAVSAEMDRIVDAALYWADLDAMRASTQPWKSGSTRSRFHYSRSRRGDRS